MIYVGLPAANFWNSRIKTASNSSDMMNKLSSNYPHPGNCAKAPDVVLEPIDLCRGRHSGTDVSEDLTIVPAYTLLVSIPEQANSGNPLLNQVDLSRGRFGGTYVHEDLAIDYAAWVSPVFKLEVYRAFKETRQSHETDVGDSIVPAGTPLVSLLEQALESEKRRLVLEAELEKAQPISRRVVRTR